MSSTVATAALLVSQIKFRRPPTKTELKLIEIFFQKYGLRVTLEKGETTALVFDDNGYPALHDLSNLKIVLKNLAVVQEILDA